MPSLNGPLSISDIKELKQEAAYFDDHANEIKKITDQMLELVSSTNSDWRGEARETYNSRFQGLSDDMKYIYDMCHEYSTDLTEIAKNFEEAETITNEIAKNQPDAILI